MELADSAGLPVLTVRDLAFRPVSDQTSSAGTAGGGGLLEVVWSPLARPGADTADIPVTLWDLASQVELPAGAVESTYVATHGALGALQSWLTSDQPGSWRW